MKNKDERMKIMTEILNGIKVGSGVETLWAAQRSAPSSWCTVPGGSTSITLQHQC